MLLTTCDGRKRPYCGRVGCMQGRGFIAVPLSSSPWFACYLFLFCPCLSSCSFLLFMTLGMSENSTDFLIVEMAFTRPGESHFNHILLIYGML